MALHVILTLRVRADALGCIHARGREDEDEAADVLVAEVAAEAADVLVAGVVPVAAAALAQILC